MVKKVVTRIYDMYVYWLQNPLTSSATFHTMCKALERYFNWSKLFVADLEVTLPSKASEVARQHLKR